ncbi:MAG: hypothetical protein LC754_14485 [Acidobacteria bacterium]|nr:hypothetical protein [Acidobacteriota bacterium]
MLRIYKLTELDPELRLLTAQYLRRAIHEDQRIAPSDMKAIVLVIGQ